MTEDNPKRLTVQYPKGVFYSHVFAHVVVMGMALVALAMVGVVDIPPMAILASVFTAYIVVVDVTPLLTDHWLTRSRLVLRQGLAFKAVLPLSNVTSVERTDEPAKVGVKFAIRTSRLFVTTGQHGLVLIRLSRPTTFRWALGKRADEVVINVVDREGFLREMNDRLALFSPVEAEGPDSELRDEGHLALVD